MDKYLDFIIPKVRPWGEDLYETANYVDTRWLEIRDDDDFHESVLHIFRAEEEYLHSIDGNISRGQWRILSRSNTLILEQLIDGNVAKSELFDLAFMNRDFFILKKHGDQIRKGQKKYFVMGRESLVRGLEWRDTMELLFNRYRNNSQFIVLVVIVVILLALMIVFSIL
ncbi:MAG: hypothetical protein AAFP19_09405 [Bacteroidota bacterium]